MLHLSGNGKANQAMNSKIVYSLMVTVVLVAHLVEANDPRLNEEVHVMFF